MFASGVLQLLRCACRGDCVDAYAAGRLASWCRSRERAVELVVAVAAVHRM
jgi:hypothetical protein